MTSTTDAVAAVGAGGAVVAGAGRGASRWANLRSVLGVAVRSPTFDIGVLILGFWVFTAIFWRVFAPYDPLVQGPAILGHPSGADLLGTDSLGRDVLSRVLAGASSVLSVAPIATVIGVVGGIIVGLVSGYYRRATDMILMRLVDTVLALPSLIVATLVLGVLGASDLAVIVVIGAVFTPIVARTVRSAVLSERDKEYVAAAKMRGESGLYIMGAEILPNITAPIIVEATVRLGYAIFIIATLSYLGLGIQPPSPDWGLTISQERVYVGVQPWVILGPAIALATLVVSVTLVADGLRKAIES
ncbi:MAG TPA: ABC transporter permease [Acidimicrobiales bacterium]|nr:ABC transporter permease [Acidimicrobiales bacterium]